MRPALLSLAVFLTYVWSSSDARGLPIDKSLPALTKGKDHHQPKDHIEPRDGGSTIGSSIGTSDYSTLVYGTSYASEYSSVSYGTGNTEGTSVYSSMVSGTDDTQGTSDYSTGYYSDYSSMDYSTGNTEGTSDYSTTDTEGCGSDGGVTMSSTSPESSSSDSVNTEDSGRSCNCGVRNTVTRIVGGMSATIHEFPWQAALIPQSTTRPFCGASIIADMWILTAAHCVTPMTMEEDAVLIGEHIWNTPYETSATQEQYIAQVIVHPGYNNITFDNDIALLKLNSPIEFPDNNKIAPICLPSPGTPYDEVSATVSGWGTLTSGGSQPYTLNHVTLNTMTNAKCKNTGYDADEITENMLCADATEGGKDSCQGDSGGPLVTKTDNDQSNEQIGIVSWGYGCADNLYPGVYTRVTKYISWIADQTKGSWLTCPPV